MTNHFQLVDNSPEVSSWWLLALLGQPHHQNAWISDKDKRFKVRETEAYKFDSQRYFSLHLDDQWEASL